MGRGRIAAVIGGLVLVGAVPAVLNAFKITNPWTVGAAALLAALALMTAGMWEERFKRLVQRRDEQRFKVVDGVLLRAGRVPTVRQVTDPLPLGVHPSAPARRADPDSGAVAGDRVPMYVPRDVDAELAERLRMGGFVVLVGDSTAGKSRAAFEAIRAALPSHELFVPGDKNIGRDVMAALVERTSQSRQAVLWLDDLEHYIRSGVITTAQISRIRDGKGHKVIVGTLRSAEEDQLTQVAPDAEESKRRLGDEAIQILGQAHKIRLRRLFTPQEVERAHAQASDERIADALDYSSEYGLAEYLAAGPHLQDAYDNAWEVGRNPRGAALVAAAIDSRRAGHLSPLPKTLLEELHQDYLDARGGQRLRPEPLEQAWDWTIRQRRSTTALLQPVSDDGARVEVFDYLVDRHQQQVGPAAHVPDRAIRIILRHAGTPDINTVARQMQTQGRYTIAAEAFQQAIQALRNASGDEHPDTLSARHNLALALGDLGRLEEAEAEHRAVLEARVRVLGAEHPDTLSSRNNLAIVLRRSGRREEAEAEHRAVLEARQRVLGAEHPDTLSSRNNLAIVLVDLGRLREAETEHRAVLEARQQVLGAEHPDTLSSRNNLANVLRDLGRSQEAETEHRAVLEARQQVLGAEHPDTLSSRNNLANVLRDLGRSEEALTLE
jgi:Flp pilus assembly protein TadD